MGQRKKQKLLQRRQGFLRVGLFDLVPQLFKVLAIMLKPTEWHLRKCGRGPCGIHTPAGPGLPRKGLQWTECLFKVTNPQRNSSAPPQTPGQREKGKDSYHLTLADLDSLSLLGQRNLIHSYQITLSFAILKERKIIQNLPTVSRY